MQKGLRSEAVGVLVSVSMVTTETQRTTGLHLVWSETNDWSIDLVQLLQLFDHTSILEDLVVCMVQWGDRR